MGIARPEPLAAKLAAILEGCPPLTEAGRDWVARRLTAYGYNEGARNFGGLRCHAPHIHGEDDRCVRGPAKVWIRVYPSEREGLRRLVVLGNLASLSMPVSELSERTEPASVDVLGALRVLARNGLYVAPPGREVPKGAEVLSDVTARSLVRSELLPEGARLFRPPAPSSSSSSSRTPAAQFRELARAWAPVLAWYDQAPAGCPCRGEVGPSVDTWRAFAKSVEQAPGFPRPDPAELARHLCALRDALDTIKRYAGQSAPDDPQWAPVRAAIADVPQGACPVPSSSPATPSSSPATPSSSSSAPSTGDVGGYRSIDPDAAATHGEDLGDGLDRHAAGNLWPYGEHQPTEWYDFSEEEIASYLGGLGAAAAPSPKLEEARAAIVRLRELIATRSGAAPKWFRGCLIFGDDARGYTLAVWTKRDTGYRPDVGFPVVMVEGTPPELEGDYLGAISPVEPTPAQDEAAIAYLAEQNNGSRYQARDLLERIKKRGLRLALPTDEIKRGTVALPERDPSLRMMLLKTPAMPDHGSFELGAAKLWLPWRADGGTDGVEGEGLGWWPFSPSAEAEQKVQEVAAVWAGLEPKIQADPKVAKVVKPQRDFWLEFYGKWQKGDKDENKIRQVIGDANVARANALGIMTQQDPGRVKDIASEDLSAARGAAQGAQDVAQATEAKAKALVADVQKNKWLILGALVAALLAAAAVAFQLSPAGMARRFMR